MKLFALGSIALFWMVSFSSSFGAEAGAAIARLDPSSKRVLFLGDSITYSGAYTRFIETYFITRYPDRPIEFINVGLSSENVSGLSEPGHGTKTVKFPRPDLHERLERVLTQTKPDLIFACYGMNDGIQLPFDPTRFAAFQSGIRRLRDAARKHGATIIHLTPPVYDSHQLDDPGYDDVLARYSAWLIEQRSAGWQVIDIRGPMLAAREAGRAKDPAFTFSRDRVHPNEDGHWVMARAVLAHLGARDLKASDTPESLAATVREGTTLATLIRQRSELLRDAWLTATGHKRPGVKAGPPLAEAQATAATLSREIASLARVQAAR